MRRNTNFLMGSFCALVFVAMLMAPAVYAGDEVLITGKVSAEGIIITGEGEEYVIVTNEMGKKLVQNAGKVMYVKGTVHEEGGKKSITVRSYKVRIEHPLDEE